MNITARELYGAVWAKPVRTLAKEWGISDVGLSKVCRKYGIPTPGLGHWAKVAVGRGFPQPPFTGDPNVQITFDGEPSLKRLVLSADIREKLPAAVAIANDNSPVPIEELAKWTKKTAKALDKKPDSSGFLVVRKDLFNVSISQDTKDRAIQILNKLETALSAAGMSFEVDDEEHHVVAKMLGESLSFSVTERYSRQEHVKKHPQYSWMDEKTYTYTFSGDLVVRIVGWFEGRKSWADGKTKRLEEKIAEVIEGFLATAEAARNRRLEMEEQDRQWAEKRRIWAEQERIAREEKEFLEKTIKDANEWAQANTIRQYAAHIRKLLDDGKVEFSEGGAEWLSRVEQCADQLDPIQRQVAEDDYSEDDD